MHRFSFAVVSLILIPLAPAQESEVSVCVHQRTLINMATLRLGETIASHLFEPIGVRLRWSCDERAATQVSIELRGDTPSRFHPKALAYALPFAREGVQAVVLYDRIEPYLTSRSISGASILGAVLAHEIGHVLESVDSHADTGLMRARWTERDLQMIKSRSFGFNAEDANSIRARLRHPAIRQAAAMR